MKRILVTATILAIAVSAFAQGTIRFSTYGGTFRSAVYLQDPADGTRIIQGNTSAQLPAGTTTYTSATAAGAGFTAELWAGPLGTADGALQFVARAPLQSGALAGYVVMSTDSVVSGVGVNERARVQVRAYNNQGGTVTSWAQVLAAPDLIPHGVGLAFDSAVLGGGSPPAPAANLFGATSFNLFVVPEPSVIALGVLGVGALLLFRRRKN